MEKYNINWTVKQIASMVEKGTLNFDLSVQRNRVWDIPRESLLIDSIIKKYPIPAIFTTKTKNGKNKIYDGLDGQQRCLAIFRFFKG